MFDFPAAVSRRRNITYCNGPYSISPIEKNIFLADEIDSFDITFEKTLDLAVRLC